MCIHQAPHCSLTTNRSLLEPRRYKAGLCMGVASFEFILSFEKAYRLLWGAEGDRCGIHAYCMVEQRSYHLRHLSHMDHIESVWY